MTSDLPQSVI